MFVLRGLRTFWVAGIALVATGCSITQSIEPLDAVDVSLVCVLDNPEIHMAGFQPEMRELIEQRGIRTDVYSGSRPARCSHYLEHTANWKWDLAMYLSYADLRVYDAQGLAGQATYDARSGSGRMDKFGPTREKLAPLVDELFAQVNSVELIRGGEQADQGRDEDSDGRSVEARLEELDRLHDRGLITEAAYEERLRAILADL